MLDLLERQERLTANQWKLILTANLADVLDFFDFFLIGYVLAFITKEWQLTYGQAAVILLSSGIGAVPGAFCWGWVADKIGRRQVFIWTAINLALATGIMYFTPGPTGWVAGWIFLSVMRFSSGSGMPASMPWTSRWYRNSCPPQSAAGSARWSQPCCRRAACWARSRALISRRSWGGVACSSWAWSRSCWC